MTQADELAQASWFTILGRGAAVAGLGLLSWVTLSIISLQSDVRVLSAEIGTWGPNRYTSGDAQRDLALRDLKIETLQMRLADVEHEVRASKIDIKQQQLETTPRRR